METDEKSIQVIRQLEFNFEAIGLCPTTDTCGCGGDHGDCRTACVAPDDGKHCPRCDATLKNRSGCTRCDRCGYYACTE